MSTPNGGEAGTSQTTSCARCGRLLHRGARGPAPLRCAECQRARKRAAAQRRRPARPPCQQCGEALPAGATKFCSPGCREASYRPTPRPCQQCGKRFRPSPRRNVARFCSQLCAGAARTGRCSCGAKVRGKDRCPACGAPPRHQRRTPYSKRYGTEWPSIRKRVIARDVVCQWVVDGARCGAPIEDVDHIVPRAVGGTNDMANLQGLCHSHHSTKTGLERYDKPVREPERCNTCGMRWEGAGHCQQRAARKQAKAAAAAARKQAKAQARAAAKALRDQARARVCQHCGVAFYVKWHGTPGTYCSTACSNHARSAWHGEPYPCDWCGRALTSRQSLRARQADKRGQLHYCTAECLAAAARVRRMRTLTMPCSTLGLQAGAHRGSTTNHDDPNPTAAPRHAEVVK